MIKMYTKAAINWPIKTIASKKSSSLNKVAAGLTIGILSLLSLGAYAVFTHQSLAKHKVIWIQKKLEKAVKENDINEAKKIFKTYPAATKYVNRQFFVGTFGNVLKNGESKFLHVATVNDNPEMAQLLYENHCDLNETVDHKPAILLAVTEQKTTMAKWLVEKGANLNINHTVLVEALEGARGSNKALDFDFIKLLVENGAGVRGASVSKDDSVRSLLGMVADHFNENPEACKDLIRLMLKKNPNIKLFKEEQHLIPKDALTFIDQVRSQT
jgi:hypothetical protein